MPDAGALASPAIHPEALEHKTIDLAILAAQREFREIINDAKNPGDVHQRAYRYATLANVLNHVRPIVNRHGLHLTSTPRMREIGGQSIYVMETHLTHAKSGKARTAEFPICKGFLPPRTTGELMTYARRYTTLSLMGVAPQDSDGDGADAEQARDINDDRAEIPSTFEVEPQVREPFLKGAAAKERVNALLQRMSDARHLDELESVWREASKLNVSQNRTTAMEEHYERCGFAFGNGDALPAPPLFDEAPAGETDAQIYTRLLRALNRATDKDALTSFAELLTDDVLSRLNDEQRSSLRSEYERRVNPQ